MSSRLIACVVVLGAARAFAGWSQITVNGAPRDVSVEADGLFTVATTLEASLMACDGGSCSGSLAIAGDFASATARLDAGCILAVPQTGNTLAGCQTGTFASMQGLRTRHAPSGFTGIWGFSPTNSATIHAGPSPSSTPTNFPFLSTLPGGRPPSLSAITIGGADYVFAWTSSTTQRLITTGPQILVSTVPIVDVADAPLFRRLDGGLGLIVAEWQDNGDILIGDLLADGGFSRAAARNRHGPLRTLTYLEDQGSSIGAGFGMAALEDGGLIGAVPNRSSPGELWVGRPPPPGAQQLRNVSCGSPRFCVAISLSAAPNAWVYWNDNAPDASFSVNGTFAVGAPLDLTLNAGDLDGDPVFVTWELDAGIFTVTPGFDGGDGRNARVVAGLCGTQSITARVSDGWGAHDTPFSMPLTIGAGIPNAPVVTPLVAIPTQAGGMNRSFTAFSDGGCAASGIAWRLDSGPGALDGGTYTPPPFVCSANGVDAVIEARALGTPDASAWVPAMVHVDPWGVPNTPMITGGTQLAGADASYPLTGQRHACDDAGVPLVVSWVIDGGAPGVTWDATASGLTVYSTDACGDAGIAAQVTYSVAGQSASTSFSVAVVPSVTNPTGFSMGAMVLAGQAQGTYSVTGAGCVQPGRLTAGVVANDLSTGMQVAATPRQDIAVNPSWIMTIPNSCNGGSYELVGTLYPTMLTDRSVAMVGRFPAGVTALDSALDVTCVGGASGTVEVSPVDGGCRGQAYDWEQLSGPVLRSDARDGGAIHVESMESGLELIGETIRWRVTATAGPGNTASTELSVFLRHRFIELAHSVGPVTAGADDLQTVTVKMKNTEPCGASAIELDELPTGLSPLATSVRVDGAPIAATLRPDGHLAIGPFPVNASQTRTVTYRARAPMFSRPSPRGVAVMKGEEVSIAEGLVLPVAPGCGCASSPSLLFGLLLVSLWPRRRAARPGRTSRRSGA